MFTLVNTTPICRVTFLYVRVWKFLYRPLNEVSYLYADLLLIMTLSPTLKLKSILVEFSLITSFSICACLRWRMYLQFSMCFIGIIMSRPNTNLPGISPLVCWYVERTTKSSSARIPSHGSASSTYVSLRLYMHTRFPTTWCFLSVVLFSCGLPEEAYLVLIPYSFSIKLFLNSWWGNYPP